MLDQKTLVAQWAYDTRPVLGRFHLWLEDVEVEWEKGVKVPDYTFAPRGIRRQLAMASAVTALGTKLFGGHGKAVNASKDERNRVKKHADAVSAYTLSEALWHMTRTLPENHAIMVCLGEGLMPKAGETPLMGANPQLGFGRVYARPEIARYVDWQVRRLLNDEDRTWDDFYQAMKRRGITLWGAAIDTLECTSRFADGDPTGPMTVMHLFDQPLVMTQPFESYVAALTVPGEVKRAAESVSILLNVKTPRAKVWEAIQLAYPGIEAKNVHVWTLRGGTRERRLGKLWAEWEAIGAHLVDDTWKCPSGVEAFTDSGTYAPTYMVEAWTDDEHKTNILILDGYAASAEGLQGASLSDALDVDVSMALCSPHFPMHLDDDWKVMALDGNDPNFASKMAAVLDREVSPDEVLQYLDAIAEARDSNFPMMGQVIHADDFFPEKNWRVLATSGYMSLDPYTGTEGVTRIEDDLYKVTSRLATRKASIRCTFTFRLVEGLEQSRLIFSPLLNRFMDGTDWTRRPVKVSDSGRIRNELQTLIAPALEYEGNRIKVHFDRIDDKVLASERKLTIRRVLEWYRTNHPVWFDWIEFAD